MIVAVIYLALATPNSFYDTALLHGMDNEYLQIQKSTSVVRVGQEYDLEEIDGLIVSDNNVWKGLHFKTFEIPLPVHHPLFITLPYIDLKGEEPSIGFKLLDQKEKEMVTLLLKEEVTLDTKFQDKVFTLPFFKNRFARLSFEKIWEDLFLLDIKESRKIDEFKISNLVNNPDKVIFQMLYNIYILKLRMNVFNTTELRSVNFWSKRKMGVVKTIDDETKLGKPQQYEQEVIFYLAKDKIYKFYLRSKLNDIAATGFRNKFFNEVSFLRSDKENAIMLYSEYNTFPYHKKVNQEGMIYLYSAWTHDMERSSFFAEMINFMERGDAGYMQVNSLYEFALKKFGSNFSSDLKKLKETQFQKLQRKISEEKEREVKELQKQKGYVPDTFESKEHKINFFLKRAKEEGVNLDRNNGELIGD
jgi:hypothetical protein